MNQPAAKKGDKVVAVDTHIVMVPSPGGPVPTPMPMPFNGIIIGAVDTRVLIENFPAATKGSTAQNVPPHLPAGGPFQTPPKNEASISAGSATVLINDQPAARRGDPAQTCDDVGAPANGTVVAASRVLIG